MKDIECPICFDDLLPKTGVVRLVCKHKFHGRCILLWVRKKPVCPFCSRKTTVRAVEGIIRRRSSRFNPMDVGRKKREESKTDPEVVENLAPASAQVPPQVSLQVPTIDLTRDS